MMSSSLSTSLASLRESTSHWLLLDQRSSVMWGSMLEDHLSRPSTFLSCRNVNIAPETVVGNAMAAKRERSNLKCQIWPPWQMQAVTRGCVLCCLSLKLATREASARQIKGTQPSSGHRTKRLSVTVGSSALWGLLLEVSKTEMMWEIVHDKAFLPRGWHLRVSRHWYDSWLPPWAAGKPVLEGTRGQSAHRHTWSADLLGRLAPPWATASLQLPLRIHPIWPAKRRYSH